MADSQSQLQIVIGLIDNASDQLKQMADKSKDALDEISNGSNKTEQAQQDLTSAVFKGTAAWELLKKSVEKVSDFFHEGVNSAIDYDASLAQIHGTLLQIGPAAAAQLPSINEFLNSLSKIGVSDNLAADAFNTLIKASGDVQQSEKLLMAASDLTSSGFYDLQTNATNLANVFTGHGARAAIAYKLELADNATTAEYLNAILGKVSLTTEDWAKTTEGQVAVIKADYENLQQAVGEGLLNAFYGFTNEAVADMNKLQDSQNDVSDTIAKFGIQAGAAFGIVIDGIKMMIAGTVGLAKSFGDTSASIIKGLQAVGDAARTHFADAKNKMDQAKTLLQDSNTDTQDAMKEIGKLADDTGQKWKDMTDPTAALNNIKAVRQAQQFSNEAAKEASIETSNRQKKSAADAQSLADSIDKMGKAYVDLGNKGKDALSELADKQEADLKNLRDNIDKTKQSINDLLDSFNQQQANDNKDIAQQIVSTQQDIADKQKQLSKETDSDKIQSLQAEIAAEQKTLSENADFITSLGSAVTDAQKRASETTLQRSIDDYNAKRILAKKEFDDKMKTLSEQLAAEKANELGILATYAERELIIKDMMTQANADYQSTMNQHYAITKKTVDAETALINSLAASLSTVRSGSVSQLGNLNQQLSVTSVHDAIITPSGVVKTDPDDFIIATKTPGSLGGGGGNVTVNILGGTYMDQNAARMFGDVIAKTINRQLKLRTI